MCIIHAGCVCAVDAEEKAEVKFDPAIARRAMMDDRERAASGAGASSSTAGPSAAHRVAAVGGSANASQLWVEKHKPKNSGELVGNQATIEWLRVFLRNWCAAVAVLVILCSGAVMHMYKPSSNCAVSAVACCAASLCWGSVGMPSGWVRSSW